MGHFSDGTQAASQRKKAMVNYRVTDIQKMIKQLQMSGIQIDTFESYDYGHFAWLKDPEGNPIELFEDKFDYSAYEE